MAKKRAFFMTWLDVPASREAEWNEWFNKTYVPARLTLPGFLSARRFTAIEGGPKYFHFFGLTDVNVLSRESYLDIRRKEHSKEDPSHSLIAMTDGIPGIYRGLYRQIYPEGETFQELRADIVLVVGIDVPSEKDEEFNAWYNTEHIPAHLRVPGFISAYRFMATREEVSPGCLVSGPKYVALYEVENEEVFQSDEYQEARTSPWTRWRSKGSGSTRRFRAVYRCIL